MQSEYLPRLSRKTVPTSALLIPGRAPTTGIVHIGLSNFHRAHLAVYTANAVAEKGGDWGILAHSLRSRKISDAMATQDLLYSVLEISPETEKLVIPGIHNAVSGGTKHTDQALKEIGKASTKIISITVTEAGYTFNPGTNVLDFRLPGVMSDLEGSQSPSTVIGLIARGLQLRARTHGEPVSVLSCDNLSTNGDHTSQLVREFVQALPEGEATELLQYIQSSVTFPNSVVDRIVPNTEPRHLEMAAARLGLRDMIPVPAEPFSMWVLEDRFAGGRPQWDIAGAIFTNQVDRYELMKLRLLNGTHSLIAYLGALDGRKTIPESRSQEFIEGAARAIIYTEYLPTLTLPDEVDIDSYSEQLFTRWSNTALAHRTSQVGSDGSIKLPQRITVPVQYHMALGLMPQYLCLTVASFLACVAPLDGFDPGPFAGEMHDPAKDLLATMSSKSSTAHDLVGSVFQSGKIFALALNEFPDFIERTSEYLDLIMRHGVRVAAREAEQSSTRTY